MTNEEKLMELGYEGSEILLFVNPSFEGALIDIENGKAVYDYGLMVEALAKEYAKEDGISEDDVYTDAIEWIEYNAIRSLPYYPNSPIIKYFDEDGNEITDEDDEDEIDD